MRYDESTLDGPAQQRPGVTDHYGLLVEALNEVQRASDQLVGAGGRAHSAILIAAHDACSWLRVAESTLRRAAIRAQLANTKATTDELRDGRLALAVTREKLNRRLVNVLINPNQTDVCRDVEQLQRELALTAAIDTDRADTDT